MNLANWDRRDVEAALEANGYESEIVEAKFAGVNASGQGMFDITFYNDDAEYGVDAGRVFVGFNKDSILVGDF